MFSVGKACLYCVCTELDAITMLLLLGMYYFSKHHYCIWDSWSIPRWVYSSWNSLVPNLPTDFFTFALYIFNFLPVFRLCSFPPQGFLIHNTHTKRNTLGCFSCIPLLISALVTTKRDMLACISENENNLGREWYTWRKSIRMCNSDYHSDNHSTWAKDLVLFSSLSLKSVP